MLILILILIRDKSFATQVDMSLLLPANIDIIVVEWRTIVVAMGAIVAAIFKDREREVREKLSTRKKKKYQFKYISHYYYTIGLNNIIEQNGYA